MNKKLKPCPFCGGEAKLFLDESRYYKSQVYCKKCGVRTNREHIPEIAVTTWNTRKPIDKVVEQLEEKSFKDYYYNESVYETKYLIWKDKAIEIVKGGLK